MPQFNPPGARLQSQNLRGSFPEPGIKQATPFPLLLQASLAFLKGLIHGLARFRTDRDFGMQVLGKNLREKDSKILQETYDFWLKVFPKIPSPGPEDATIFLDFMQLKGQRDPKEFVDGTLVQELEREGFVDSLYKER